MKQNNFLFDYEHGYQNGYNSQMLQSLLQNSRVSEPPQCSKAVLIIRGTVLGQFFPWVTVRGRASSSLAS